jgi:hypothetical protein
MLAAMPFTAQKEAVLGETKDPMPPKTVQKGIF